MFKKLILVFITISLVFIGIFLFSKKSNKFDIPIIVWVWERPENLYFLKDKNITFAYLSGTVTKKKDGLVFYPRRQPLRIPDKSKTISVIRVEDKSDQKVFNDKDLEEISNFIVKSCQEKESNIACQIDFDATESQIDFYKKLILKVKSNLKPEMKFSITALVSWCTNSNSWFDELPIGEAVPMFFRLGKEENVYWQKINNGDLKLNSVCQKAIGIATDESVPNKIYLQNKPIYIFNNQYWNQSNWNIIKSDISKKINE